MTDQVDLDPKEICARGRVTAADVLAMRRAFNQDSQISEPEADWLFAINSHCAEQDPEWAVFFAEALTDYVVHQAEPQGYVTAENADWLISSISADGIVQTMTELELLVKVLEEARWSPQRLVTFALQQVKIAVLEGKGPLRSGSGLEPGVINAGEVELVRRILFAYGGDGNIAVTRPEAEILFDINDATAESRNDPAWSDLFVKAIANSLMAATGHAAPTRQEAMRQDEWLEERESVAGLLSRVFAGGFKGIWDLYGAQSKEDFALEKLERERIAIITSERIEEAEAQWLSERIGRDGKLHENEKALLAFIRQESPSIHPSLEPLLAKAA